VSVEWQVILAAATFLIVYALIVTEKFHRAVAALAGAVVIQTSQRRAFPASRWSGSDHGSSLCISGQRDRGVADCSGHLFPCV